MFTGLIEDIGIVRQLTSNGNYRAMAIESKLADQGIQLGESICCDGACLTVTSFDQTKFAVEASQETVTRTIIDSYKVGTRVNLERALRADSRLGGHLVSGHVDCRGTVEYLKRIGESLELAVTYDGKFDPYVIEKGSIAVQGVSLTVNAVKPGWCSLNLIPITAEKTTLGSLGTGDRVNLEFDMIGKYIVRVSANYRRGSLTMDNLIESGW